MISNRGGMRILNVADFNWMTGAERDTVNLSLFDICRKLGFAATRAGHLVVEFSDRAVARRGIGGPRDGEPALPADRGRASGPT